MTTGEKIRYLRIKNNLTSKELSKILNISESYVSLIENRKRMPSLDIIVKIADHFKVTTDFLLGAQNSSYMKSNQAETAITDISDILENIMYLLNNKNYILLDGKDVDHKTALFLKNSLYCMLENARVLVND